ncbi:hypothetical protein UY3_09522 [Chelonia mydas]|uniref:Uncharacterized protein n=1 Tax=Chelonia mydas TaxID=8469 RepID=M7BMY7_CHEMY|nr:hypothetical protein UY3_09522 [Chelonia mydas]
MKEVKAEQEGNASCYQAKSRRDKLTPERSPVDSCTPALQEAQAELTGERQQLTHRGEDTTHSQLPIVFVASSPAAGATDVALRVSSGTLTERIIQMRRTKRNKEDMFQEVLQASGASDCHPPSSLLTINEKMQRDSRDGKYWQQMTVTECGGVQALHPSSWDSLRLSASQ